MAGQNEQVALSWVREEIEKTLLEARQALEAFADNPTDSSQATICAKDLRQVRGTLQILDIPEAAALAEALEQVAARMASGAFSHSQAVLEPMMEGILQLELHLQKLYSGRASSGAQIIATTNRLRKQIGLEPIALSEETDVFALPIPKPSVQVEVPDSEDALKLAAKKLRPHFQKGLLAVIRDEQAEDGLSRIEKVLDRLQAICQGSEIERLWWLASAYTATIKEQKGWQDKTVHGLLGQVDRQLKRLAESGSAVLSEKPNAKLLQALLTHVLSAPVTNDKARAISNAVHGQEHEVVASTEALEAVAGAMRESIANLKDAIDIYVRTGERKYQDLEKQLPQLKQLADTLLVLGLNQQHELLIEQINDLRRQIREENVSDSLVMDLAGSLLYVEAALSEMTHDTAESSDLEQVASEQAFLDAQYHFMREARVNLQRIQDAIVDFMAAGGDRSTLAPIADWSREIEGGFRLLDMSDLADLIHSAQKYIDKLSSSSVLPEQAYLDALADVYTGIEYYLEGFDESGKHALDSVLDAARNSLQRLETLAETLDEASAMEGGDAVPDTAIETQDEVSSETETVFGAPASATESDDLIDEEILEIFAEEATEVLETLGQSYPAWKQNSEDKEALTTTRRSFHTLKGSGRLVGATVIGELAWAVENLLNKIIAGTQPTTEEIWQLLDEVMALLPTLINDFKQGKNASSEAEALAARAHAIAGGIAPKPGQAATSETTEATISGTDLTEQTEAVPPAPVEQTSEEETVVVDEVGDTDEEVEETPEAIDVTSEAPLADVPELTPEELHGGDDASVDEDMVAHAEPISETDESSLDQALVEVFCAETETHMAAIHEFIDRALSNPGETLCDDDVVRALHTIKGSANMTGVLKVSALVTPLEAHFKQLNARSIGVSHEALTALQGFSEILEDNLPDIPSFEQQPEDERFRALKAQIEALDRLIPALEVETESGDNDALITFLSDGQDLVDDLGDRLLDTSANLSDDVLHQASEKFARLADLAEAVDLAPMAHFCAAIGGFLAKGAQASRRADFVELLSRALASLAENFDRIAASQRPKLNQSLLEALDEFTSDQAPTTEAPSEAALEVTDSDLVSVDGEETFDIEPPAEAGEGAETEVALDDVGPEAGAASLVDDGAADSLVDEEGDTEPALSFDSIDLDDVDVETVAPEALSDEPGLLGEASEIEAEREVDELPGDDAISSDVSDDHESLIELSEPTDEAPSNFETGDTTDMTEATGAVEEEIDQASDVADDDVDLAASDALAPSLSAEDIDDDAETSGAMAEAVEDADTAEDEELEEIRALFIEEAEELMNEAEEALAHFEAYGEVDALLRILHTLKGAARLANQQPVADLAHELETALTHASASLELTRTAFEQLDAMVAQIKAGEDAEPADALIASLKSGDVADIGVEDETTSQVEKSADITKAFVEAALTEEEIALDLEPEDKDILDIYLEEAEELLTEQGDVISLWQENQNDLEHVNMLQRQLHTLKGGARISGLTPLADVAHELENLLEQVTTGRRIADSELIGLAQECHDAMAKMVERVKTAGTIPTANALLTKIRTAAGRPVTAPGTEQDVPQHTAQVVPLVRRRAAQTKEEKAAPKPQPATARQSAGREMIRVDAATLETLANLAGETSIYRSRLEQQVTQLRFQIEEIDATVERVRTQLRNLEIETEAQIQYRREMAGYEDDEFDPLEMDRYTRQQELTRSLGESTNDLLSLKETMEGLVADAELLLLQQSRVDSELQDRLMRTRLVPFTSVVPRLRRMVRQIGQELGKPVVLAIQAEGEMDRTVLERLIAPIEHMLRNAIDHGIESKEERLRKGKPEQGRVSIRLYREGAEVVVEITDDGRGIDLERVRKKALERGLIAEGAELTDHELQLLILEAGFSTAETVTQISGRGVGMDVVNSEIKQMGGLIDIQSERDRGTTFTVRLPFTVSVNQALMVRVADSMYAIPYANIEGVVRVSPFELEEIYRDNDPTYMYSGQPYSVRYLGRLLKTQDSPNLEGLTQPLPLLLLHGLEHPVALQVDELAGSREIVVKSVGVQLSSITGISGATILGDGRVVLILDLPALWRRADAPSVEAEAEVKRREDEDTSVKTIMVVDDSITVRKVTSRLLQRHGYQVLTAKDGVDALNVLHDQIPDLMLLDIEMPRMDGFELASTIRHDERLKHIPIIMITSRTGDKHRSRAEEIGVNRYMGKPYNEIDLLQNIESLLEGQ